MSQINTRRFRFVTAFLTPGCVTLLACGAASRNLPRFENRDIIWSVDDRRDVPVQPENRVFVRTYYYFDVFFPRSIEQALDFPATTRAKNVNALDEVPNSTWFWNRISRHEMTARDVFRGPGKGRGPDTTQPLRVKSTKAGGVSPGFVIEDARGDRYILKFDVPDFPEMETGAAIVAQRLLWAAGYHVPEDHIVQVPRSLLQITEDSKEVDIFGDKKPLTSTRFEEILANVPVDASGMIRGLASAFLPGIPVGGYAQTGIRGDDPNDQVAHEDRRDVRGQFLFFAWLDHTDVKEDNTLDVWVEDRNEIKGEDSARSTHFLMHYLVDFGKALGVMGATEPNAAEGFAHSLDFAYVLPSLFTLGAYSRPWEAIEDPNLPGVGRFQSQYFHPSRWRARFPYTPFIHRDRFDDFWSAKIIARFTGEHVQAAVDAAQYSDASSRAYLTQILLERRHQILRYAFRRVAPLGNFRIVETIQEGGGEEEEEEEEEEAWSLCFEDLWQKHRLEEPGDPDFGLATHHLVDVWSTEGRALREPEVAQPRSIEANTQSVEMACTPLGPLSPDAPQIFSIEVVRGPIAWPLVHVSVALHPENKVPRIIGLYRE